MIKYFDGEGRKTTVEAAMNHVNVYLNGRKPAGDGLQPDMLIRYYEEFAAYTERMNEEFDLTRIQPAAGGRGLKGVVKRAAAKCVGWYMRDINKRQTDFNMHLLWAINSEKAILGELVRQSAERSRSGREKGRGVT